MIKARIAFDEVLAWILRSSADPTQISLTVKGMALTAIPLILTVTGIVHLGNSIDASSLSDFFNAIGDLLTGFLTVVSLGMTFYGAARKIWIEIFGKPTGTASFGPNAFSGSV